MGREGKQLGKGKTPAASSKAAEFLATSASSLSFGGFGTGFPSTSTTPSGFGIVDEFASVDPELRILLKKISKRDSTTKSKALDEILVLLKTNVTKIESFVAVWDSLFNKLAIDVDRKVRESALQIQRYLAQTAPKRLAPILKKIIGTWIAVRFDVSKEVAILGKESFRSSFSEEKTEQVLVFCQADLLAFLANIILEQSVQSMSDPRYTSPEDMVAKYARTVAASFDSLSFVLETVSMENRAQLASTYQSLFLDKRLWAHATHEQPLIRSSVYRLVKHCILKAPEFAELSIDNLSQYFLSKCFGEKDSECYSYLWDAVLLLTKHYPTVWIKASEKKPVINKFYACLAEAMYGSGKYSYPCVLPLIAHLPVSVCDQEFFKHFLGNMWKGNDKIDRFSGQVFLKSYYECCQYLVKSCPDIDVLMSRDFLRPIESLLEVNSKQSKVSKETVCSQFLHFYPLMAKSLKESSIAAFEKSLLSLMKQSLESDRIAVSIAALEYLVSELWKDKSLNSTIVLGLLPSVMTKNIGDTSGLLMAILNMKLDFDTDSKAALRQFAVTHADSWKSKEGMTEDKRHLILFVKVLIITQKDYYEDNKRLWKELIAFLLRNPESFENLFATAIDVLKGERTPLTDFVVSDSLLDIHMDKLTSCSTPDLQKVLVSLLALDESIQVLSKPVLEFISQFLLGSLDLLIKSTLVIRNKKSLSLDRTVFQNGFTALYTAKYVLEQGDCAKGALQMVCDNFYSILQLSICDPTTIGSFKWDSTSNLNITDTMNELRELAKCAVSLFRSKKINLSSEMASQWGILWNASFSNMDHCASPLDYIEEIKILMQLSTNEDYLSKLWSEILQTPKFWNTMSAPYYSKHSPSMSIADPMLIWTTWLPYPGTGDLDVEIQYDHDGLSEYSRRSLLLMGILKDHSVSIPSGQHWLTHELLRFRFVCSDSLYREAPFPFIEDALLHAKRIDNDVAELLSRLCMENSPNEVESLVSLCQKLPAAAKLISAPTSLLSYAFSQVVVDREEGSEAFVNISDCRIFGYLLGKSMLEQKLDAGTLNLALVNLLKSKKYYLVSSLLLFSLPVAQFEAVGFVDFCKSTIRAMTCSKLNGDVLSDEIRCTVVFCHLLESFKEGATDLISNQERNAILRWVRMYYDAKISGEPASRDEGSLHSILVDAIICNMLEILMVDVNCQSADIGLNMANFVANLCSFWLKQIACSTMTQELACLLYHSCKLWQALQAAADEDTDSWQRVVDAEDEVEDVLIRLFITSGQSDMLSTLGFAKLQGSLADQVMQLSNSDFLRTLVSQEALIYKMYFTLNEQVQKAAYTLAHSITVKRVQDVSVSLEMQSSDPKPVYLKEALVVALKREWGIGQEVFGNLLTWISLLDHFVDATFDLRQYYTNHLRDLNVLGPFLEFIFTTLNVDSRKGVTFNLGQWQFEEYMVEGFDSTAETSIPLLCSHLFYRLLKSLPTLVRLWFSECKNRQLVLAVENFTEKYYSPLLVAAEFKNIQNLADDSMSIRVNPKTYDVTASYTFEEAELDIVLRLPLSFPLKLVDVASGSGGGRMAGISDARWRGWLLAVSSIMIGHNGSVADSLAQFKKNVSMHFEGIEDCAICYSVISLADRSTPQKACRVCKHVFHGSCLYKWFKSSNQNACPLCRQPI